MAKKKKTVRTRPQITPRPSRTDDERPNRQRVAFGRALIKAKVLLESMANVDARDHERLVHFVTTGELPQR